MMRAARRNFVPETLAGLTHRSEVRPMDRNPTSEVAGNARTLAALAGVLAANGACFQPDSTKRARRSDTGDRTQRIGTNDSAHLRVTSSKFVAAPETFSPRRRRRIARKTADSTAQVGRAGRPAAKRIAVSYESLRPYDLRPCQVSTTLDPSEVRKTQPGASSYDCGPVHPKSKWAPSRIASALSRASFMSASARASLTRADSACTRCACPPSFTQFCTSRACSISFWLMSETLRPGLGRVDGLLEVH
jgi:hypothetical protein